MGDIHLFELLGKHAIVTGAARGIGACLALEFAKNGAHVALLDKDEDGLETTAKAIQKIGKQCEVFIVDLQHPANIEQVAKKLFKSHPAWDILVNNAALVKRGPLLDFSCEDWDLILNVNLRATFLLSRLIVPKMINQKSGKIIHLSSNATFFGTPGSGPYAVSKAGINQLTKTMALEWGPHNIQVNAVCPGLTDTELMRGIWNHPENQSLKKKFLEKIPLGRFAEVDEVAKAILFLASPLSNYINGTMLTIDNGARYCP